MLGRINCIVELAILSAVYDHGVLLASYIGLHGMMYLVWCGRKLSCVLQMS